MIALNGVTYRYPGTQRDALHAIDLAVGEGELPGVIRLGHRYVVAVPRLLEALGAAERR